MRAQTFFDLEGDARPDWRPGGATKQPKHRGRVRTRPADWRKLHARKGGPCRLCGRQPYELHHLLSRARGGPNIAENLVPLCPRCHELVTNEDAATLRQLAAALEDAEYAWIAETLGEAGMGRLFGV